MYEQNMNNKPKKEDFAIYLQFVGKKPLILWEGGNGKKWDRKKLRLLKAGAWIWCVYFKDYSLVSAFVMRASASSSSS